MISRSFGKGLGEEQVVEHDAVHPSFSVTTEMSDVFSFCLVHYQENFQAFITDALKQIELKKQNPTFEDEPGRDDFLFMSSFSLGIFYFFPACHALFTCGFPYPEFSWGKILSSDGKSFDATFDSGAPCSGRWSSCWAIFSTNSEFF